MTSTIRKFLFWIHLSIGIASGLIIALMSITGAIMAFDEEITRVIDSPVSSIAAPANAERLSIDALLAHAKQSKPDTAFTNLQTYADPNTAWVIQAGREQAYFINPFTGELTEPRSTPWKSFFHQVEMLHRWLLQGESSRDTGKSITGAANLAFFGLCLTGLYLWFPIHLHRRALKSGLVIHWKSKGKARDYNWHKVFGFWALPILLIITITGAFFSYAWMKHGTTSILGTPPPRDLEIPADFQHHFKPNSQKLPQESIYQSACSWSSTWKSINLPLPKNPAGKPTARSTSRPQKHQKHQKPTLAIAITESDVHFPRRPSQILLSPVNAELIAENDVKNFTLGQKILVSIKGIHTGEAAFLPGKILTFLAAISATILVYTGFALSFRRLKRKLARRT